MRNRNVRKFVRGVATRTEKAKERGLLMRETRVEKVRKNPRASALEMQKVRSLLREVEKHNSRKQYGQSEKLLIQVLTLQPDSFEARTQLAKIFLLTERPSKAEALYRELVQERQEDVSLYANLGLACYRQGAFHDACEAYRKALHLDSKNPERAAALGRACMAARRFTDAAKLLEQATERLARNVPLLQMLADCYERLGHMREAEDTYKKIHRLQPYDEQIKAKIAALASV